MIIADETDEAAKAKWEHYKAGTDLEALAYRDEQAEDDPSTDIYAQPNRRRILGTDKLPTNQGVLVGSYASVARMLDELAAVPGVRGVMMTFDDFVIGMEQFGTRIMPLMRCRERGQDSRMNTRRSELHPAVRPAQAGDGRVGTAAVHPAAALAGVVAAGRPAGADPGRAVRAADRFCS